jgi:hypothetical protein
MNYRNGESRSARTERLSDAKTRVVAGGIMAKNHAITIPLYIKT